MPFDPHDRDDLLEHFANHGEDFGATTPQEYEAMADNFMTKPRTLTIRECIRQPGGILCRYDLATEEYGVMDTGGRVITYFVPVPAPHLPPGIRPIWMHGHRTNLEYFHAHC